MKKLGTFGSVQAGLSAHLQSLAASKQASLSAQQGKINEQTVPQGKSDPEVGEILPHGNQVPAEPTPDLTQTGVETGEKLPGQTSPTETKRKREEISPEAKLASVTDLGERLATNLKLAAQMLANEKAKSAAAPINNNVPAPGSDDPAGVPSIPTGGKDLSEGGGHQNTDAGKPVIQGVKEVTKTEISKGDALPSGQGTQEKAAELNLELVGQKIAEFSHRYQLGHQVGQTLVGLIKEAAVQTLPHEERQKQAAARELEIVANSANALVDLGVRSGIITDKQASDLMAVAGFQPSPLVLAISNLQEKIAGLIGTPVVQANDFLCKVAAAENPAAVEAPQGGQGQVDPGQLQAAIGQLIAELHQAVQSGQMTEEQALQLLREQGLPVEEMMGGAQDGAPAGAPAGGPDIEAIKQQAAQVVAKLHELVESGQITEDQAIDYLKQQGLPVDEMLAGAGSDDAAPSSGAQGGVIVAPHKEAAGEDPAALMAAQAGAGNPEVAGGAPVEPAAGAPGQAPNQLLQEIIQELEQAVQSGQIPAEKAQAILEILTQSVGGQGGIPADPAQAAAVAGGELKQASFDAESLIAPGVGALAGAGIGALAADDDEKGKKKKLPILLGALTGAGLGAGYNFLQDQGLNPFSSEKDPVGFKIPAEEPKGPTADTKDLNPFSSEKDPVGFKIPAEEPKGLTTTPISNAFDTNLSLPNMREGIVPVVPPTKQIIRVSNPPLPKGIAGWAMDQGAKIDNAIGSVRQGGHDLAVGTGAIYDENVNQPIQRDAGSVINAAGNIRGALGGTPGEAQREAMANRAALDAANARIRSLVSREK